MPDGPKTRIGIYYRGCPRCGGDAVYDPYEREWRCVQCARRVMKEDAPECESDGNNDSG